MQVHGTESEFGNSGAAQLCYNHRSLVASWRHSADCLRGATGRAEVAPCRARFAKRFIRLPSKCPRTRSGGRGAHAIGRPRCVHGIMMRRQCGWRLPPNLRVVFPLGRWTQTLQGLRTTSVTSKRAGPPGAGLRCPPPRRLALADSDERRPCLQLLAELVATATELQVRLQHRAQPAAAHGRRPNKHTRSAWVAPMRAHEHASAHARSLSLYISLFFVFSLSLAYNCPSPPGACRGRASGRKQMPRLHPCCRSFHPPLRQPPGRSTTGSVPAQEHMPALCFVFAGCALL